VGDGTDVTAKFVTLTDVRTVAVRFVIVTKSPTTSPCDTLVVYVKVFALAEPVAAVTTFAVAADKISVCAAVTVFVDTAVIAGSTVFTVAGDAATYEAWLANRRAFNIDCKGTTWSLVWIFVGIAPLR
jgi:hypothetical protein